MHALAMLHRLLAACMPPDTHEAIDKPHGHRRSGGIG